MKKLKRKETVKNKRGLKQIWSLDKERFKI